MVLKSLELCSTAAAPLGFKGYSITKPSGAAAVLNLLVEQQFINPSTSSAGKGNGHV